MPQPVAGRTNQIGGDAVGNQLAVGGDTIMGSLELGAEASVVGGPLGVVNGALVRGAVGAASGVAIGLAKFAGCNVAGF